LTIVVVRRELLWGLGRLNATTTVLQRARLADPLGGMWEAADVQWWWRRSRATDELALPVWFDKVGPVAAAGLTAWDDTWQADVFAVPSIVDGSRGWSGSRTDLTSSDRQAFGR
jgi:hypothetical protein